MEESSSDVIALKEFLTGIIPILFSGGDGVSHAKYKEYLEEAFNTTEAEVDMIKFAQRDIPVLVVELSANGGKRHKQIE